MYFLDKTSRDLFICAKDLFVEATAVKLLLGGPYRISELRQGRRVRILGTFGFSDASHSDRATIDALGPREQMFGASEQMFGAK